MSTPEPGLLDRVPVVPVVVVDDLAQAVPVARALVAGGLPVIELTLRTPVALDAIRAAGGGLVEAYPEQVDGRPPQRGSYFHTGPENLFEELGFVRDRQIAKWRWVMRRRV